MIAGSMRLAIVETAPFGGLLHYAAQLADAMARRGHDVDLLISSASEMAGRPTAARLRPVLIPPVRSSAAAPSSRLAYLIRRAGIAVRLSATWARIVFAARRGRYDAVLLNCDISLPPAGAATLALASLPGPPAIAWVAHNVRPFNRWSGDDLYSSSPVVLGLMRRVLPRLDLVLVHGERSRAEFEATWPPTRLRVVPHGDERLFAGEPPPPGDEERILFFGDWRKVKGLGDLMAAFDELVARRPTARLTIAGNPAPADLDPDAVRRWAAGHGERVEVIDRYVPMDDVAAVFGRARVVVTPYRTGYQSGVIHLAMTMARAVVTTDVGDLGAAVVDGETGRVVPPGDRAALVDALDDVLSDPAAATRLGAQGRVRLLAGASWEVVAERLEGHLGPVTASR